MTHSPLRRTLLMAGFAVPLAFAAPVLAADTGAPARRLGADERFAELERSAGGRLGVCALDTGNGTQIGHRADERFPFCSTFKLMLAAAILARSEEDATLLERHLSYTRSELVNYSPISGQHVDTGMSVAALCAAAVQYSDNTAANLLIALLGGPAAVTAFARRIGDRTFRLDRRETELNTAIPHDPRDTTTPAAMVKSASALVLGDALQPGARAQLQTWLRGNTTGGKRIRAAVPDGWQVGDKTGTGDRGTANDVGVVWSPSRAPIVLGIYHTQEKEGAKPNDAIIAAATRIVLESLG